MYEYINPQMIASVSPQIKWKDEGGKEIRTIITVGEKNGRKIVISGEPEENYIFLFEKWGWQNLNEFLDREIDFSISQKKGKREKMMKVTVDQQNVAFEVPRPLIVAGYPSYKIFITDDVSDTTKKVVSEINISFENKTIFDENEEDGFIRKPIIAFYIYNENGILVSKTEVPLAELSANSKREKKEILSIENDELYEF